LKVLNDHNTSQCLSKHDFITKPPLGYLQCAKPKKELRLRKANASEKNNKTPRVRPSSKSLSMFGSEFQPKVASKLKTMYMNFKCANSTSN
jgi:hypothetical protein